MRWGDPPGCDQDVELLPGVFHLLLLGLLVQLSRVNRLLIN